MIRGLAAAALGLGLFALWDVAWVGDAEHSVLDYVTRGTAFFLLGGIVGAFAERVRRISAEIERFWELSSDLLCTAGADGHLKRLNPGVGAHARLDTRGAARAAVFSTSCTRTTASGPRPRRPPPPQVGRLPHPLLGRHGDPRGRADLRYRYFPGPRGEGC